MADRLAISDKRQDAQIAQALAEAGRSAQGDPTGGFSGRWTPLASPAVVALTNKIRTVLADLTGAGVLDLTMPQNPVDGQHFGSRSLNTAGAGTLTVRGGANGATVESPSALGTFAAVQAAIPSSATLVGWKFQAAASGGPPSGRWVFVL
jgi:hypothetical protein